MSDEKIVCPHLDSPLFMPKYIQLKDPDMGCMYLREGPQILMFPKFNEQKDALEFFYSELLLYFHWRSVDELYPVDLEACLAKFRTKWPENTDTSFIESVKNELFPEMNNVEMARAIMDEYPEDQRPSHIGDTIDNQNEQDILS